MFLNPALVLRIQKSTSLKPTGNFSSNPPSSKNFALEIMAQAKVDPLTS
jgi:hypothetical protein